MKTARAAPALAGCDDAPLSSLRGVGASLAEKLAARDLATAQNLWLHLPLRYEDRTQLTPIREVQPGVLAQSRAPWKRSSAASAIARCCGWRSATARERP